MPVFPEVGSRMMRPGVSEPSASACSIIFLAMRSLSEPVGLAPSSLAHSRTDGFGLSRGIPTSGVLPIASRMSFARTSPDYPRGRACPRRSGPQCEMPRRWDDSHDVLEHDPIAEERGRLDTPLGQVEFERTREIVLQHL